MTEPNDIRKLQLEIGGSFFELIEFSLTRNINGRRIKGIYGVNVAKVREVVRLPEINPLSSRVPGVAGIFELRGIPIPAVNLSLALGDQEAEINPGQQIIVTEFSQKRAGFIVDSTHRIRRVAWDKVLPPSSDAGSFINGMTLIEKNQFLFILDLERILVNLEMSGARGASNPFAVASGFGPQGAEPQRPAPQAFVLPPDAPSVLLVDDSQFIRNGVRQGLARQGYRVIEASDGAEAFSVLEKHNLGANDKNHHIDVVVTDVEMPRMDGLSFTRKVREHPKLKDTPVVLHTSLSGRANQEAGQSVGANGYVIKNDLRCLFELLREILGRDPSHAASA